MSRSFLVDSLIDNKSSRAAPPLSHHLLPPTPMGYLLGRLPNFMDNAPAPTNYYPKHLFQPFCCSISLTPHPHYSPKPKLGRQPLHTSPVPEDYTVKREPLTRKFSSPPTGKFYGSTPYIGQYSLTFLWLTERRYVYFSSLSFSLS